MPFSLIDRTAGTNIGNMTNNGGLAAAFDGTTSQALSASAAIGGSSGYVGKTLATEKRFGKAIVYGPNNTGFTNYPTVTLNIRGKDGAAPASASDGTLIGTTSFTDTADESSGRTIISTDGATKWDHIFVQIVVSGGSGDASAAISELALYEFLPVVSRAIVIG